MRASCGILLAMLLGLAPLAAPAQRLEPGQLLVASPMLAGTDFAETVLLLIYHEDDSSLAIALNRPTWVDAATSFADVEALAGYGDPLYLGGPVSMNQLLILFEAQGAEPELARQVLGNIYVSPELSLLQATAQPAVGGPRVRLYAGHVAWAPGRLEAEIESGAWRVLRANADQVFTTEPEHLWESLPLLGGDLSASR